VFLVLLTLRLIAVSNFHPSAQRIARFLLPSGLSFTAYHNLSKHATTEETASSQGMKRSTYEEHLRKAELKILRAVRPYARLAYTT
jgi:hypothetical protein